MKRRGNIPLEQGQLTLAKFVNKSENSEGSAQKKSKRSKLGLTVVARVVLAEVIQQANTALGLDDIVKKLKLFDPQQNEGVAKRNQPHKLISDVGASQLTLPIAMEIAFTDLPRIQQEMRAKRQAEQENLKELIGKTSGEDEDAYESGVISNANAEIATVGDVVTVARSALLSSAQHNLYSRATSPDQATKFEEIARYSIFSPILLISLDPSIINTVQPGDHWQISDGSIATYQGHLISFEGSDSDRDTGRYQPKWSEDRDTTAAPTNYGWTSSPDSNSPSSYEGREPTGTNESSYSGGDSGPRSSGPGISTDGDTTVGSGTFQDTQTQSPTSSGGTTSSGNNTGTDSDPDPGVQVSPFTAPPPDEPAPTAPTSPGSFLIAPLLASSFALPAMNEDAAPQSHLIAPTVGTSFNDAQGDNFAGIAVISNNANVTEGVWRYSTDGGANWYDIGGVSEANALLLSANTMIHYDPAPDWNGQAEPLIIRGIDDAYTLNYTTGAIRSTVDINTIPVDSITQTNSSINQWVNPVNDAPTIDAIDTTGNLLEDSDVIDGNLFTTGSLIYSDVDIGDILTVSLSYNNDIAWDSGDINNFVNAEGLNSLTINSGVFVYNNEQSRWEYTAPNNLVQFLGAGETITLSYTVTVTDDSGEANDSVSDVVTITITGVNDAPFFVSIDNTGNLVEG